MLPPLYTSTLFSNDFDFEIDQQNLLFLLIIYSQASFYGCLTGKIKKDKSPQQLFKNKVGSRKVKLVQTIAK